MLEGNQADAWFFPTYGAVRMGLAQQQKNTSLRGAKRRGNLSKKQQDYQ